MSQRKDREAQKEMYARGRADCKAGKDYRKDRPVGEKYSSQWQVGFLDERMAQLKAAKETRNAE